MQSREECQWNMEFQLSNPRWFRHRMHDLNFMKPMITVHENLWLSNSSPLHLPGELYLICEGYFFQIMLCSFVTNLYRRKWQLRLDNSYLSPCSLVTAYVISNKIYMFCVVVTFEKLFTSYFVWIQTPFWWQHSSCMYSPWGCCAVTDLT